MSDDHGTLRDEGGNPKVYLAIAEGGLPSVPLMESQVWPEGISDWEAIRWARSVERLASPRIRASVTGCARGHEEWWLPTTGCPWCGACV